MSSKCQVVNNQVEARSPHITRLSNCHRRLTLPDLYIHYTCFHALCIQQYCQAIIQGEKQRIYLSYTKSMKAFIFLFFLALGCTVVQTVCFVCLPYSPVLVFNVYMVCAGCLVVYQALHGGLRGSQGYARGIWG